MNNFAHAYTAITSFIAHALSTLYQEYNALYKEIIVVIPNLGCALVILFYTV